MPGTFYDKYFDPKLSSVNSLVVAGLNFVRSSPSKVIQYLNNVSVLGVFVSDLGVKRCRRVTATLTVCHNFSVTNIGRVTACEFDRLTFRACRTDGILGNVATTTERCELIQMCYAVTRLVDALFLKICISWLVDCEPARRWYDCGESIKLENVASWRAWIPWIPIDKFGLLDLLIHSWMRA